MLTIFFSWQSDRPEKHGRYFIEEALKETIDNVSQDVEFQEAAYDW
jgi:hypothetical protein